jgi:WD40 repeat protein
MSTARMACLLAAALLSSFEAAPQRSSVAAAAAPETPTGLSIVWRLNGHRIEPGTTGTTLNAFSPDGRYVAVYESLYARVFDAEKGNPIRVFALDPASVAPFSLAVSSDARVALGRMGNAEVLEQGKDGVRYWCAGACGSLAAVAFSPDGRHLAYQGTRGLPEWRTGLGGVISVVDLASGSPVNLEAVAAIPQVSFSADGRELYAMNVTQVDDRQSFGARVWSTTGWRLARTLPGTQRPMRRVAPLAGVPYAGVSMKDGNIEARDLENDRVLWSVPLVPPDAEGTDSAPSATNLDLVEVAPNGRFVLSYEAPTAFDATGRAKGTLVIRRAADGIVEAFYDLPRLSDLSIAPDGKTFAYSTAAGDTYTAVARVPF